MRDMVIRLSLLRVIWLGMCDEVHFLGFGSGRDGR